MITQLARKLPPDVRDSEAVRELASYGCLSRIHIVQLLAPRFDNENHTKDVDFSPSGLRMRCEAGYKATERALNEAAWLSDFDPLEGVILHRPKPDHAMAAE